MAMQDPNAIAAIDVLRAEVLDLRAMVATLARTVAELRGGTCEGAFYTHADWRESLAAIAKRAERRS
jgi:hypothetical protein